MENSDLPESFDETYDMSYLTDALSIDNVTEINQPMIGLYEAKAFEDYIVDVDKDHIKMNDTISSLTVSTLNYNYIASFTGDDEIVTTDCKLLAYAMWFTSEKLVKIKMSWKDVGISKFIGNYAEEWILTPPTEVASFDPVENYFKGEGVPYTLDTIKTRMLSPIRKQSEMELDLESKMRYLAEAARWTNKSWFTYDFHQLSLLLGTVIFDYESAKSFPFLTKNEGGCGGAPPWGNLMTLWSYLHYFHRGKSKKTIIGIMKESVRLFEGSIKPRDCIFTRATHLAIAGDTAWKRYVQAYKSLRENNLNDIDMQDLVRTMSGTNLPTELLEKAIVVQSTDYTIGVVLAKLRTEGLIMTETDAKIYEQSLRKANAIVGEIPFRQILLEIEAEKQDFKKRSLKILSDLYDVSPTIKEEVKDRIGEIPNEPTEDFTEVARRYYKYVLEHIRNPTSFVYTDQIRIFKRQDVLDFYRLTDQKAFVQTLIKEAFDYHVPDVLFKPFAINEKERIEREELEQWIKSADKDIFNNPLPIGSGTDDNRITRAIGSEIKKLIEDETKEFLFIIIITNDDNMMRELYTHSKRNYAFEKLRFVQLRISDYICLCNISNRNNSSVKFYNYLKKDFVFWPKELLSKLRHTLPTKEKWGKEKVMFLVEYDVPNIEKSIFSYKNQYGTLVQRYGGYLSKRTLRNFRAQGRNISTFDMNQLWLNPDFSVGYRNIKTYREPRFLIYGSWIAKP